MQNAVVLFVLAVLVFFAVRHLRRARKKGDPCAGCPYGGSCGGHCDKKEK